MLKEGSLKIVFKNLDRSELAKEAVTDKLQPVINKFPDLLDCRIDVTLEMHNSLQQPGPDVFAVALHISSGKYRGTRLTKSASNLYMALADLAEHLLEKLNRAGDRSRVKLRNQARAIHAGARERLEPAEYGNSACVV